MLQHLLIPLCALVFLVVGAPAALGQNFPTKPIRIVTSEPGGSNDLMARIIAAGITGPLGQQVIIENRPAGVIPGQIVAAAPPDGYTLLVTSGILWLSPLMQKVPYDPIRDFAPVTYAVSTPNILVVHPSVQANSVKELLALAKAKPGALNYSSGATGSSSHLAAELFRSMADINVVRVPYKGAGPAVNGLLGGEVQFMLATTGSITNHIATGKVRALGVSSAKPSALAPGIPTIAASGVPGYEAATIFGVLAPGKTPSAIINRLNQEMVRVLNQPEVKDKFLSMGVEVVASSPQEFATAIKAEMTRMGKVIKEAGLRVE